MVQPARVHVPSGFLSRDGDSKEFRIKSTARQPDTRKTVYHPRVLVSGTADEAIYTLHCVSVVYEVHGTWYQIPGKADGA